jgi:hypothetical protein
VYNVIIFLIELITVGQHVSKGTRGATFFTNNPSDMLSLEGPPNYQKGRGSSIAQR